MSDNPNCPKCDGYSVKNGFAKQQQRWKCKACSFQFTRLDPKGKPLWMKLEAALMYISGLSLNAIAKNLQVSTPSVLDWVKAFGAANYEKPEPRSAVVVELDEMWHFIESKKTSCGYGKPLIVLQGNSLTGSLDLAILKPLSD